MGPYLFPNPAYEPLLGFVVLDGVCSRYLLIGVHTSNLELKPQRDECSMSLPGIAWQASD